MRNEKCKFTQSIIKSTIEGRRSRGKTGYTGLETFRVGQDTEMNKHKNTNTKIQKHFCYSD